MSKLFLVFFLLSFAVSGLELLLPVDKNKNTKSQNNPKFKLLSSAEITLNRLKKSAQSGNTRDQLSLANMYHQGGEIEANRPLAFYWYKQVAEKGFANAEFKVGTGYYYGVGVKKSLDKAVIWLKKAADNNHTDAKKLLASIIETQKQTAKITKPKPVEKIIKNQPAAVKKIAKKPVKSKPIKQAKKVAKKPDESVEELVKQVFEAPIKIANKPTKPTKQLYKKPHKESVKELVKQVFEVPIDLSKPTVKKPPQISTQYNKIEQFLAARQPQNLRNQITQSLTNNSKIINKLQQFLASAKSGNPNSQNKVAMMYINGHYAKQDYKKAYYWANASAKQGNKRGAIIVDYLVSRIK